MRYEGCRTSRRAHHQQATHLLYDPKFEWIPDSPVQIIFGSGDPLRSWLILVFPETAVVARNPPRQPETRPARYLMGGLANAGTPNWRDVSGRGLNAEEGAEDQCRRLRDWPLQGRSVDVMKKWMDRKSMEQIG